MGFATNYMAKHGPGKRYIENLPEKDLKCIAVIPAYNESGLIQSLDSLLQCKPTASSVEIITVFNWPFGSDHHTINENLKIREEASLWAKEHNTPGKKFHFITAPGMDKKNSGVGFARKTGMDEAICRFNDLDQPAGIILSLDADVKVEKNYFLEIEKFFNNNMKASGCNIYFEHPLTGNFPDEIYKGVIQYELHMRYYIQSLRYAGHPNAFHTIGSAFAVRAKDYCLQGGMNKRQAGEDFYFLQKFFDLGNFSECKSTTVYPSPRPSMRVPFGTGMIISDFMTHKQELGSYHPELFEILRSFLEHSPGLYDHAGSGDYSFLNKIHRSMQNFLVINHFQDKMREIWINSSSRESFHKRFFRWFNMFRVLKFLNFGKNEFPAVPVLKAAGTLLLKMNRAANIPGQPEELLYLYREIEKMESFNRPLPQ